jgi:hypothetical protein
MLNNGFGSLVNWIVSLIGSIALAMIGVSFALMIGISSTVFGLLSVAQTDGFFAGSSEGTVPRLSLARRPFDWFLISSFSIQNWCSTVTRLLLERSSSMAAGVAMLHRVDNARKSRASCNLDDANGKSSVAGGVNYWN